MSRCSITVRGAHLERRLSEVDKGRVVSNQLGDDYFVILFSDEPDPMDGGVIMAKHVALQYCQTKWAKQLLRKEITIEFDDSISHDTVSMAEVWFMVPGNKKPIHVDINLGVGKKYLEYLNETVEHCVGSIHGKLHGAFRKEIKSHYPGVDLETVGNLEIVKATVYKGKLTYYTVGEE